MGILSRFGTMDKRTSVHISDIAHDSTVVGRVQFPNSCYVFART